MLRTHIIDGRPDRQRIEKGLRRALADVVERPSASMAAFPVGTDLVAGRARRSDGTTVVAVGRDADLASV